MSAAICGLPADVGPGYRYAHQGRACWRNRTWIRAKGSRHSPVAPNGCTMVVFFLKPTAVLKKALQIHTSASA